MLIGLIDKISAFAATLSGVLLVSMVGLILYEIFLRSALGTSTFVMDEFVGYGVATMTFLAFAATLRDGVFIRVNLILARLGPRARRAVEVISCLTGTALFSFLSFYFLRIVWTDFKRGTVSNSIMEVPLWIPQAAMAAGLVIFVLQFAALTVAVLLGAPINEQSEEL